MEALFLFLTTLFAVGTFAFWVLVLAVSCLIALEVHFDKGTPATLTLVGTVVFLHFFSGVNILRYVWGHLGWVATGAVLYLAAGAVWSLIKLAFHTKGLADRYRREKVGYLRQLHLPPATDLKMLDVKKRLNWEDYVSRRLLIDLDKETGAVTFDLYKRQATVVMWIGHWPFSLLGTVLNDPVRKAINLIYERMIGLYEKVITTNLGNTKGEITTHDEEAGLRTAGRSSDL